jgi:hypothetical protein
VSLRLLVTFYPNATLLKLFRIWLQADTIYQILISLAQGEALWSGLDIQGTKRREKTNWASCFSFGGKSEKREIEEYLRTKNNQFPG